LYCNGIKDNSIKFVIPEQSSVYKKYKLYSIKQKPFLADSVYYAIHKDTSSCLSYKDVISKPFYPTWEFTKIFAYLNPLLQKHSLVLTGVTGAGKTTLVDKLALFITGNKDRIKYLQCSERMEVEYNKEWIGYWTPEGFQKGKLIYFFEQCKKDSLNNYVFILDDFDKIYPTTFWGSAFWTEMDNPQEKNYIEGYGEISFPENFYLISVTHIGVTNVIELNDEHFRRLGEPHYLGTDYKEFLLYLIERIEKKKLNISYDHAKALTFFYTKINKYIEENYGKDYTLGQWSSVKSYLSEKDFDKLVNTFIIHVNAFKPQKELTKEDLDFIFYALDNNGLEQNTFFFYKVYEAMVATGLFSEITVALAFAIVSGLFGWLFLHKKKKLLEKFQFDVISITEDFKNKTIDFDTAMQRMVDKKNLLEELILTKKIKYEEITFLLVFIEDQMSKMVELNKMFYVTKEFYSTFDSYMKDGVIDKEEFKALNTFLETMRPALSPEIYFNLKNMINEKKA
jgi:hypothetical protein